jgi:hypothetical protein
MTTLAELFNAPEGIPYGDKTYRLREPDLLERGEYAKWLAAEARAEAANSTDLPDEDRRRLISDTNKDIAMKRYAWGSAACVESLGTLDGIAKLMSIVCRAQGVTFALALKICESRVTEVARILLAAEVGDDPEKKALARQLLTSTGLPPNFLSSSWSASSTTATPDPPPSPPSPT